MAIPVQTEQMAQQVQQEQQDFLARIHLDILFPELSVERVFVVLADKVVQAEEEPQVKEIYFVKMVRGAREPVEEVEAKAAPVVQAERAEDLLMQYIYTITALVVWFRIVNSTPVQPVREESVEQVELEG